MPIGLGINGGIGLWPGVKLAGGGVGYLLRDDFLTDATAPLTSPRTAEPGPGTLTLIDTDNKLSVSGGVLACAGGKTIPAWGDPGMWGDVLDRRPGLSVMTRARGGAQRGIAIGFDTDTSGFPDTCSALHVLSAFFRVYGNAPSVFDFAIESQTVATWYGMANILRSSGSLYVIKNGLSWNLLWVDNAVVATPVYPVFANYQNICDLDTFRALDLPAPFTDDYGLATQRLAGARSAGDTLTHTANCLLEWTQTTIPSALQTEVRFRIQDATNYWQVTVDSTGALDLDEVVAGTPTQRATAAAVIANGDRIVVIADGTTIRVYEANTLRITYASAANFATATAGELETEGTGGSVSDIVSWPRQLSGSPAAILDQVSG